MKNKKIKAMRANKPGSYILTKEEIEAIKMKASEQAFILMLGLPVMVLHDKWGWRRRHRLPRFMDQVLELYDSFDKGLISLTDIIKTVEEETGIRLERTE